MNVVLREVQVQAEQSARQIAVAFAVGLHQHTVLLHLYALQLREGQRVVEHRLLGGSALVQQPVERMGVRVSMCAMAGQQLIGEWCSWIGSGSNSGNSIQSW